jgi:hypothetical protein
MIIAQIADTHIVGMQPPHEAMTSTAPTSKKLDKHRLRV